MTNSESKLNRAINKLDNGVLNQHEAQFIEQIKGYDKKQLKKLTYKQYKFLEGIADK